MSAMSPEHKAAMTPGTGTASSPNILLVTTLYPTHTGQSAEERTYALHRMVKRWQGAAQVLVVVPRFIYARGLLRSGMRSVPWRVRGESIDGIRVVSCPVFKIPRIGYWYGRLYTFARAGGFRPDLVLAHYGKSIQAGYHIARSLGLPFVAGLHIIPELDRPDPAAFRHSHYCYLAYASAVACRSPLILRRASEFLPELAEKMFPLYSGVEAGTVVGFEQARARLSAWRSGGCLRVVTAAKLLPQKNVDTVIRALGSLHGIDWKLTVLGNGPQMKPLRELAMKLAGKRVEFRGWVPAVEVRAELEGSHLFIMVSAPETMGIAYLEAMAAGALVIGSRGQGIDGIVRDGENGFLVPAGDLDSLSELLARLTRRSGAINLEGIIRRSLHTIRSLDEERIAAAYLERLRGITARGV
ncbi:MAG: glycosyltransferase family 4 protein [Candidatus Aminicenantes bacterium]|nr:glycosyltransferase family 4 protein [Candidatus Aminicenantes bacterium]